MAFYGVFIGIDRYASTAISWLSCARRDAVALEALFADTVGGTTVLVTDAEATRARIAAEFERLTACAEGDTVVIAFSGHGSETHELITYDADVSDLASTAISLDELTAWFTRIPARRAVLLLDCCFSGGAGAKVLKVETLARQLTSAEARLAGMAGAGRLIVTASAANEPAWENQRSGTATSRIFSWRPCRGRRRSAEGGRLPVYRLLEYVTRRVADAARVFGHAQNPAMRGSVDGELSWPVFVPGARYKAAFPERARAVAGRELGGLAAFGFPPGLIECWSKGLPGLNELQIAAINEYGALEGAHLVAVAPTSSGKTMIGELAALRAVLDRQRALFLLPLKALVADKRREFEARYGEFGLRIVEATGETDDLGPILRGQYDIGLFTYEKFAAIALSQPHVVEQTRLVVVDEAQMLADASRGANLEFLLTLLRMKRRMGIEPQIMALSGAVGETMGLERWLGGRLLRRDERPVPLDEGIVTGDGVLHYIDAENDEPRTVAPFVRRVHTGKNSSQEIVIPLLRRLVGEGQQVIVFRAEVGETRGCAAYLAQTLGLPPAREALERLPQGDQSMASRALRDVLEKGVAFHNSHLGPEEKRIVEEEFREGEGGIRVIVATTTLAMGVNTPASSVVVAGLAHPGGKPYSVAEYKNLVGRAGRLGRSERGASYIVAMTPLEADRLWSRYVKSRPESLASRFFDDGTDLRSLIMRTVVAGGRAGGLTQEEIGDFLEGSFGAFQETERLGHWRWDKHELIAAVGELERHGLVGCAEDGRCEATALGRLAGESGAEVASIVRLVECLKPLQAAEITDPALIAAVQNTVELDGVYVPINKKTAKEEQSWMRILRDQGIAGHVLRGMGRDIAQAHDAGARAKRAVAALAYIAGQEMEEIESLLGRHGGGFDGSAGPVRSIAGRTCDLVGAAARVAELLHPELKDMAARAQRLAVRLTHGIPGPAVELGRELGARLSRGAYLRLVSMGLSESTRIAAAGDGELLTCLDGDVERLRLVRSAAAAILERRKLDEGPAPVLAPYAA